MSYSGIGQKSVSVLSRFTLLCALSTARNRARPSAAGMPSPSPSGSGERIPAQPKMKEQ